MLSEAPISAAPLSGLDEEYLTSSEVRTIRPENLSRSVDVDTLRSTLPSAHSREIS